MDLLPRISAKPGRKQTVTAKAWIDRPHRKAAFISRVSLGKGRIHERSTQTTHRGKALEFNRLHLIELLTRSSRGKAAPVAAHVQLDLTESRRTLIDMTREP